MQEYTIEKDGKSYTIVLDGEPTPERIQAAVAAMEPQPEQVLPGQERARRSASLTQAEAIAGNPATRYAVGAADMIFGGPAQLGTAIGGFAVDKLTDNPDPYAAFNKVNEFRDRYKELEQAGMEESGTGFNLAGLLGGMSAGAGAMSRYGVPKDMVPRMLQGAAQGTFLGAMAPAESDNYALSKALQTGMGAGLGFVMPAAFSYGADTLRSATGSTGRYLGELANKAAGPDRIATAKALIANRLNPRNLTNSETVAGFNNPVLAKVLRTATGYGRGGQTSLNRARNQLLLDEIDDTFGASQVDDLINTRRVNSQPHFRRAAASREPADIRRTLRAIQNEIDADPENTVLVNTLNDIKSSLMKSEQASKAVQGGTRTTGGRSVQLGAEGTTRQVPETSMRRLISASNNFRGHLDKNAGDRAVDSRVFGILSKIKRHLQNDLAEASDDYRKGITNYLRDSEKVNQAIFGRELRGVLGSTTNSLDDDAAQIRVKQFTDAVDDPRRLLKQIDLSKPDESILSSAQREWMETAANQLRQTNNASLLERGAEGGATANRMINEVGMGTFPNPLNRILMVINRAARDTETSAQFNTLSDLAEIPPEQLGKLMLKFNPEERVLLDQFLGYLPVMGGIESSGGANRYLSDALRNN